MSHGSNPNLLDNPDFKINQRGATSSDAYGYFIADRWRGNYNDAAQSSTLTRNEDGSITIKLTKSMTGSYWWLLVQNGEDILKIGQTYTLSCKVRNATPSAFMLNTWGSNTTAIDSESGIYSITMYIDNLTNIRNAFGIVTNLTTEVDSSITIEWMKLEKGSVATPFVPPNPATELLKCQRYYQLFGGTELSYLNTDRISIRGQLPVPMRITPTVKLLPNISSVHVYDGLDAGLDFTVSGVGGCVLDNSHVRFIDISFTDLNSNPRWVILDTAPLVELSADL